MAVYLRGPVHRVCGDHRRQGVYGGRRGPDIRIRALTRRLRKSLVFFVILAGCYNIAYAGSDRLLQIPSFTIYDDEWNEFLFPPKTSGTPFHILYFETPRALAQKRRREIELLGRACSQSQAGFRIVGILGGGATYADVADFRERFAKCLRFFLAETSGSLTAWLDSVGEDVAFPRTMLVSSSGEVIFQSRLPLYTLAFAEEYGKNARNASFVSFLQDLVNAIEAPSPRWQAVLSRIRTLDMSPSRSTLMSLLVADAYRFKSGGVPDSYATLLSAYPGITYLLDHFLDGLLKSHVEQFYQKESFDSLDEITAVFNRAIGQGKMSALVNTSAAFLNLISGQPERAEMALRQFPHHSWDMEAKVLYGLTEVYAGKVAQGVDVLIDLLQSSGKAHDVLQNMSSVFRVMMLYHRVRGKILPTPILLVRIAMVSAYGGSREFQTGGFRALEMCASRKDEWGKLCRAHRDRGQITFNDIREAAS